MNPIVQNVMRSQAHGIDDDIDLIVAELADRLVGVLAGASFNQAETALYAAMSAIREIAVLPR